MIELGQTVRDRISGFVGVVTGAVDYLTGCRQYLVAPPVDKDGKMSEAHWLDAARLEVVDAEPIVLEAEEYLARPAVHGPDQPPPIR